jgi:predicted RNA-binding protein with PUA-like domain
MYYLLKTEPSTFSFADLQQVKKTEWDGVKNPVALKNLASMKKGDELIIYHTGDEKAAVGIASVVSVDNSDPKSPVVTIAASAPLRAPVTLSGIKAAAIFRDSPLVRQGRLSVVPLTAAQHEFITRS